MRKYAEYNKSVIDSVIEAGSSRLERIIFKVDKSVKRGFFKQSTNPATGIIPSLTKIIKK